MLLLAEMKFDRYKILVQVVLGEQRGAGVKIGARCMWDSDADNYASAEYENVSSQSIYLMIETFDLIFYYFLCSFFSTGHLILRCYCVCCFSLLVNFSC